MAIYVFSPYEGHRLAGPSRNRRPGPIWGKNMSISIRKADHSVAVPSQSRRAYFDLLSLVASFGVVAMHCNGIVHWGPTTPHWSQALAVEVLFYWAVPIFFMLTGAKTMSYRNRLRRDSSLGFLRRSSLWHWCSRRLLL